MGKNEFIYFMQRACENQDNDCYIELYNILLRAFVSADCDFDGQVSEEEFGGMIAAANALPRSSASIGGRATPRTSSRRLMRMVMVASRLTNGWDSPTRTIRARSCPLLLTSQRKMHLSLIAKRSTTQPLRLTRSCTSSVGSASRLRTRTA